jgi:hypothetical protein
MLTTILSKVSTACAIDFRYLIINTYFILYTFKKCVYKYIFIKDRKHPEPTEMFIHTMYSTGNEPATSCVIGEY